MNVLDGALGTFETTSVGFQLMRLHGEVNTIIEACTINKVTGNLKALNWKKACGWDHLREVKFPYMSSKKNWFVDWFEIPDLHFSIKDVIGKPD